MFEDPLVLARPPNSPLASRPNASVAALDGIPFTWFRRPSSPSFYDDVAHAFEHAGVRPSVVQTVASHVACASLVAAGVGATLVPSSMASLLPAGVEIRPLVDFDAQAVAHALWRADEASPAVSGLLEFLRAARADVGRTAREA